MGNLEKEKEYFDLKINIKEARALLDKLSGQDFYEKDYKEVVKKIAWYVCQ